MRPEEYEGEMIDPRCDKCGKSGSHICAPTSRELLRDMEPRDEAGMKLAARVEKVLALHVPFLGEDEHLCNECRVQWPCPTVRILNGEKP